MTDDIVERLKSIAKNFDAEQAWHGNHEDSDCEPHWSSQEEAMDAAKTLREAVTLLTENEELRRERDALLDDRDRLKRGLMGAAMFWPSDKGTHRALKDANDRAESAEASLSACRKALAKLVKTTTMLHQNSVACAVEHHGLDLERHGLSAWLADASDEIVAARALTGVEP